MARSDNILSTAWVVFSCAFSLIVCAVAAAVAVILLCAVDAEDFNLAKFMLLWRRVEVLGVANVLDEGVVPRCGPKLFSFFLAVLLLLFSRCFLFVSSLCLAVLSSGL